MVSRTATVASSSGLHSRPAAVFAKAVAASGHSVKVSAKGKSADARSILGVLGLGVNNGDEVVLEVEGAEPERVADELQALLQSDLDAA